MGGKSYYHFHARELFGRFRHPTYGERLEV